VARLLGLLGSRRLVQETGAFFETLLPLESVFRERALGVEQLLRAPGTAFVLVCTPSSTSLADAGVLTAGLAERGVELRAAVLNRAFVAVEPACSCPVVGRGSEDLGVFRDLLARQAGLSVPVAARVLEAIGALRAALAERNAAQQELHRELALGLGPDAELVSLPDVPGNVCDLESLAALVALLDQPATATPRS